MVNVPEFNKKDLEEINRYLAGWDKWRKEKKVGFPDCADFSSAKYSCNKH